MPKQLPIEKWKFQINSNNNQNNIIRNGSNRTVIAGIDKINSHSLLKSFYIWLKCQLSHLCTKNIICQMAYTFCTTGIQCCIRIFNGILTLLGSISLMNNFIANQVSNIDYFYRPCFWHNFEWKTTMVLLITSSWWHSHHRFWTWFLQEIIVTQLRRFKSEFKGNPINFLFINIH